jgi:hypothetical protein
MCGETAREMNLKSKKIRKGSCQGAALEGVAKSDEEAAGFGTFAFELASGFLGAGVMRRAEPAGPRISRNGAREGPLRPRHPPPTHSKGKHGWKLPVSARSRSSWHLVF